MRFNKIGVSIFILVLFSAVVWALPSFTVTSPDADSTYGTNDPVVNIDANLVPGADNSVVADFSSLEDGIKDALAANTAGYEKFSSLFIDDSNTYHLVYANDTDQDDVDTETIVYRKSTNNGTTWSAPVAVVSLINNFVEAAEPEIVVDNATIPKIYILFHGSESGQQQFIYYADSVDGGDSWTVRPPLYNLGRDNVYVQAAVDDSNAVHAVWIGDEDGTAAGRIGDPPSNDNQSIFY